MIRAGLAAAALALVAACAPEEGPLMMPGQDCLACHDGGMAPRWTFAGTVFPAASSSESDGVRGVRVHATDATGKTLTVVSNEAGNFYLADELQFPLRVEVERDGGVVRMEDEVEYGGCNSCHSVPPREGAVGRVFAP